MFRSRRMRSGLRAVENRPSRRRNSRASTPSFAWRSECQTDDDLNASMVRRASAGVSSTRRISSSRSPLMGQDGFGNGEEEGGSSVRFRFDPNASAMAFNDFFAYRQTNTSTGVLFASMKTLENDENPLEILGFDADAIVL